ncbi:Protein-serine O-palmitoleoyltransferase porcupine [Trichoplax sp. H2]|nr:Protein-serine O-palmitoleoyltransferase porcupine [Trichoplax sp. H2]|eukprot:RDD44615.1 Protein-serine O-palmitoleoyltransferase porcupine [Trichoplax sp. H2]
MEDGNVDLYLSKDSEYPGSNELINLMLDSTLSSPQTWFSYITQQYYECMIPLLSQILFNHYLNFYPCILFRLLVFCNPFHQQYTFINHAFAGLAGTLVLWLQFESQIVVLLVETWIGYVIIRFFDRHRGIIMALVSVCYLMLCEFEIIYLESWQRLRGIEMVLAMKLIALAVDVDSKEVHLPISPMQCFGYCNFVGTAIFGPFMTYNDYQRCIFNRRIDLRWSYAICKSLILGFICLIISTCVSSGLREHSNNNKWIIAWLSALSFRFSHYFVCLTSEATSLASGYFNEPHEDNESLDWQHEVVKPSRIELPRSLVEVVIYWNMPIHWMLKKCKITLQFFFAYFESSIVRIL